MKLIAISGKKRSGKDTVAAIIRRNFKGPSISYYFASALKHEVARACGVKTEFIDQFKDNFRLILQGWGTDYRRKLYGDDFWIKQVESALRAFEDGGNLQLVVIPDCRFKNEFDYLKKRGAAIIRVRRQKACYADSHISETDLDDVKHDFVIDNNGTIEELVEVVSKLKL